MKASTAAEARLLGVKHYFTGIPCKRGHVANRLVSTNTCAECLKLLQKQHREKDPLRFREVQNRSRKLRNHDYNSRAKEYGRAYTRKKAGIPEAPYPCPANCECCGKLLETGKRTHLDHDHVTSQFRGWLCNACNLGIGMLGDSVEGLERAIRYLTRTLG